MSETVKHTPGPWTVFVQPTSGERILVSADDDAQNIIVCDPFGANPQDEALIEAAPDLLAACKEWSEADGPYVSLDEQRKRWPGIMERMRAAVAKAERR